MNISWSLTDDQMEAAMEYFDWDELSDVRDECRRVANRALNEKVMDD